MTHTAPFTGYQPLVPARRAFDLWRLLVPEKVRTEDHLEDVRRWVGCLQEVVALLLQGVDRFTDLADLDRCSDAVVDAMLADLGNPFPVADWGLGGAARRKLARNLVALYRARGTAPGIVAAVRLLLGVETAIAPHLRTGWLLGVDRLGSGTWAEICTSGVAPWDFTAAPPPWTGTFSVDEGVGQVITVVPGDFADPAAATAAELVTALAARLTGAGAYAVADGSPAILDGGVGPYDFTTPGRVLLTVGADALDFVLDGGEFADPAVVHTGEACGVLNTHLGGIADAFVAPGTGVLRLRTRATGAAATLEAPNLPANTGAVRLALSLGAPAAGADGQRVAVYSATPGRDASIALTTPGCALDVVCGWWPYRSGASGGAELACDNQRALYTFDVVTAAAVDAVTAARIRIIADLWRCAHEHVGAVRVAEDLPWPAYWVLGVDALGEGALLGP